MLRTLTAPLAVAILAILPGLAWGQSITKAEAEYLHPETGLRPTFGSRYVLRIGLDQAVSPGIRSDCVNPPAIKVTKVTVLAADSSPQRIYEYDIAHENLRTGNAVCTARDLIVPLDVALGKKVDVSVVLSNGAVTTKSGVALVKSSDDASGAVDWLNTDFSILYGGESGKLGASLALDADFTTLAHQAPFLTVFDTAALRFNAESAAGKGSQDFKEAITLQTDFVSRFGDIGQYYALIAKPIALEADDDVRNINYKGAVAFALAVPGTREIERMIQPLFGDCLQGGGVNCTSFGLVASVGYAANNKVKRNNGRIDRSADYVTVAEAFWNFPLNEQLSFISSYTWQSDSPDGSSSESSEVGFTYKPGCAGVVGVKVSWINGEFMPGDQRKDALRFALTRAFGANERAKDDC